MTSPRAKHRIMGREYKLLTLPARPRRVRSKGHTYYQYTINVPRSLLPRLLEEASAEEGQILPLTILVAASPWHHLIDWAQMPPNAWNDLPDHVKRELDALGLDPENGERILIPARPEQLRELGLDPEKPITLEDVVEAVKRRLAAGTPRGEDGREAKPKASSEATH